MDYYLVYCCFINFLIWEVISEGIFLGGFFSTLVLTTLVVLTFFDSEKSFFLDSSSFFALFIYLLIVDSPIPLILIFFKSSGLIEASFSTESMPAALILSAVALPIPEISSKSYVISNNKFNFF